MLVTLLLTKVHTLFKFPKFVPNVLLRFPDSIQKMTCLLDVTSWGSSGWRFPTFSLFSMTLTVLREYWSALLQNILQLGFVWCFLMIRLELWVSWGGMTAEIKCCFHRIISRGPAFSMTYHGGHWPWSPGWGCVVRCPHCTVRLLFLPFPTVPFGSESRRAAHANGVGSCDPPPP